MKKWTRSETITMSKATCKLCEGVGLALDNDGLPTEEPCGCVLRAIFRACLERFRKCDESAKSIHGVQLERIGTGRSTRTFYGLKNAEYIADFWTLAHRTLTGVSLKVFKFHYLYGADWKLCSRRLGLNRGNFFHECYRIEEKLGRVFHEVEPYALFPLDEYFRTPIDRAPKTLAPAADKYQPLQPPMAEFALYDESAEDEEVAGHATDATLRSDVDPDSSCGKQMAAFALKFAGKLGEVA